MASICAVISRTESPGVCRQCDRDAERAELHPYARQALRALHGVERHCRGRLPRFERREVLGPSERLVRLAEGVGVVGHLLVERGIHDVVAPELHERERLDRAVLHRRRSKLTRQLDTEIARLDAPLEIRPPVVVPHHPEVVLLEAHRIVQRLEPLAELLGAHGRLGPHHETQRGRLRLDREPLVTELVGQADRLLDVRRAIGA